MKFLRVNRFLRVVFLPVMFGIVVTSCHKGSEKQMKEVVNGFSSAYFRHGKGNRQQLFADGQHWTFPAYLLTGRIHYSAILRR